MKNIISIAIVDDHKIFRTGLEVILNGISFFKVVGSYADGKSLMNGLAQEIPDVIFMDIKLPEDNGIMLTKLIKKKYPSIKIVALTMFGEIEYFNEMFDVGADGFLLKSTDGGELEKAVKEVVAGQTYFAKEFLGFLSLKTKRNTDQPINVNLSERELEVLKLICEGFSNNEIAEKLFISAHTVDGHRRNLIAKTGVKNAPNLVLFALKNGLID
ncbi:MAG: response regulator [Bacteroidales bacterium]